MYLLMVCDIPNRFVIQIPSKKGDSNLVFLICIFQGQGRKVFHCQYLKIRRRLLLLIDLVFFISFLLFSAEWTVIFLELVNRL